MKIRRRSHPLHPRLSLPRTVGILALAVLAGACAEGTGSTNVDAAGGSSTAVGPNGITIAMEDISFDPAQLTVRAGDAINFRFTNDGKLAHDAFVGDTAAQLDHAAEMAAPSGGDSHSDSAGHSEGGGHSRGEPAVLLQPGESGDLTFTFDRPGAYEVGCHQPGHYDAGMKIKVTVV